MRNILGVAALAALLTAPVLAAPADQVRARIAGYRALGAAFKSVNDGVRGNASTAEMRRLASQISGAARAQYAWYPAGSGPRPGVKTAVKADVWTRQREFRAAQDAFAAQAQAFERVAASGNAAAIRSAARRLGANCKGCHDAFRIEND